MTEQQYTIATLIEQQRMMITNQARMTDKESAFSLSVVLPAVDYSTYSSKPHQIPPGLVSACTEVGLAVIGKWWLRALPSPYSQQPRRFGSAHPLQAAIQSNP
jgi:hypothetical protein